MLIDCLIPYTSEQLAEMEHQLASLIANHLSIEAEKKKADDGFNQQLKEVWAEVETLSPRIKAGGEMEPLDCKRLIFPEEGMTRFYRQDTGEMVKERAWTKEEEDASRQMEFPEDHMLPPPDPELKVNFKNNSKRSGDHPKKKGKGKGKK